MKKCFVFFAVLILLFQSATAHRLNEYLQATTIRISPEKLLLTVRLTAGRDVAASILKGIDVNNDKLISEEEQQKYVARFSRDVSFTLDGSAISPKLVFSSFPVVDAVTKGIGDIVIEFEINPGKKDSAHQLHIHNSHQRSVAVFLVNCLIPADANTHVISQDRSADQSDYTLAFVTGDSSSKKISQSASGANNSVFTTYLVHGIHHILSGYDHLLFLFALVLGAAGLWDLIKIVTAFTVAHSLTFTLAAFGLAHMPEDVVEVLIAASIVFVAFQNILMRQSSSNNLRLMTAFFFGLFHGLGFAGGLLELMHSMSTPVMLSAVAGFSVGVEIGNQFVLLPVFGLLFLIKRALMKSGKPQKFPALQKYASLAVALAGMYYLLLNLLVLW